jgi:hypothetical protein
MEGCPAVNEYGRSAAHIAKLAAGVGGAGIVAVALTGCLTLDAELAIEDESVSGTAVLAASKEFLAEIDAEPDELMSELPGVDVLGAAVGESYEDDDYVGWRYEFDAVDIAELAGSDSLAITYDPDEGSYEVTGRIGSPDFDVDDLSADLAETAEDTADLSLAITFPGEVTEHNGELSDTTVRWELAFDEVTDIRAVAFEGSLPDDAEPAADDGGDAGEDGDSAADTSDSEGGLSDLSTPLLVALAIVGAGAVGTVAFWVSRRET